MKPNSIGPLLLLGVALCAFAEEQSSRSDVTFELQYRGRADIYDGVNKAAYGDASIDSRGNVKGESNDRIFLQQLIAGVTYTPSPEWEYKAYLYDSRGWGSSLQSTDFRVNPGTADEYVMDYYNDHAELYTTYVRRHDFLTDGLSLTLGRMKLGYGDRRVFGPGEWGNTMGWLWDGIHLSYREGRNFIDGWYGQTRIKAPDDFSVFKKHRYQGAGVYGHYETAYALIEPFAAWKNPLYHETLPYENFYYGGSRIYREGLGWNWDITGIREWGKSGTKHVDAYGYVLRGGYQAQCAYKPKMMLGYTFASGDQNARDDQVGTFTTPFGMNDGPLYGRMDLMIWSNIKDAEASVSAEWTPAWKSEIGLHRFHLADPSDKWYEFGYRNQPGKAYTHLGDEIDLILQYQVSDALKLLGIASYFQAGDFITGNNIAHNNASKFFLQFEYRFSNKL